MTTILKSTETATSTNYPYGRLRCTATWSLEFKPSKGFRVVFQTINPKTNRLNSPKKSTYSPVILLTQDENGYVSSIHHSFNGIPELNKGLDFMTENFDKFTDDQIKEIYATISTMIRVSWGAIIAYCGADKDATKELLTPSFTAAIRGFKNGGNSFQDIKVDVDKYEALKKPDFSPFRTVTYE